MQVAALPANEPERLRILDAYRILDTPPEEGFDDLTRLAAAICGTPMALISLIDARRQWFKSRVGMEACETPRDVAFCTHAILQDELFIVPDAMSDDRFVANPLVMRTPNIRFYAGAPLITPSGHSLGTLCVLDTQPRTLTPEQIAAMRALARQTVVQLELRRQFTDHEQIEQLKKEFVSSMTHELRTPLTSIRGALGLLTGGVAGDLNDEARQLLTVAERNSIRLITLIDDILAVETLESGKLPIWFRLPPR